jgi:hypothetical protein
MHAIIVHTFARSGGGQSKPRGRPKRLVGRCCGCPPSTPPAPFSAHTKRTISNPPRNLHSACHLTLSLRHPQRQAAEPGLKGLVTVHPSSRPALAPLQPRPKSARHWEMAGSKRRSMDQQPVLHLAVRALQHSTAQHLRLWRAGGSRVKKGGAEVEHAAGSPHHLTALLSRGDQDTPQTHTKRAPHGHNKQQPPTAQLAAQTHNLER